MWEQIGKFSWRREDGRRVYGEFQSAAEVADFWDKQHGKAFEEVYPDPSQSHDVVVGLGRRLLNKSGRKVAFPATWRDYYSRDTAPVGGFVRVWDRQEGKYQYFRRTR